MSEPVPSVIPAEGSAKSDTYWRVLPALVLAINSRPRLMRWILGGPVTLIATLAIMAAMTVWWPRGAAGIDQIGMPLILSPVIWVSVFVYALLDENLTRASLVMLGLIVGNGVLLAMG